MSVSEILDANSQILNKYINQQSINIDISQVDSLQANLNLIATDITNIQNKQLYSEFYALMPSDNSLAVAVGSAVQFPQNGPTNNTSIIRSSATQFILPAIGTYEIFWQCSVLEVGQLGVALNGTLVGRTVVGRDSGNSQIVGRCMVTTTVVNTLLTIVNPVGNAAPLTLSDTAGGNSPVSANLIIKRVN